MPGLQPSQAHKGTPPLSASKSEVPNVDLLSHAQSRAELPHAPPTEDKEATRKLKSVLRHLTKEEVMDAKAPQSFGERLADHVTDFLGRWSFIGLLTASSCAWMGLNSVCSRIGLNTAPDPFPYPLLNLGFALIGGVTAPIILMSQNHQNRRQHHRVAEFQDLSLLRAQLLVCKSGHPQNSQNLSALSRHLGTQCPECLPGHTQFLSAMAHRISESLGSWKAVGTLVTLSGAWMGLNELIAVTSGVRIDPYPYIFLNLGLSMIAALTGPVVLMCQSEQQKRDEAKARWFEKLNELSARVELEGPGPYGKTAEHNHTNVRDSERAKRVAPPAIA